MKERPILFSGEMVRAILEGRKTQTRRVVSWPVLGPSDGAKRRLHLQRDAASERGELGKLCPYGRPGDRLWVRETWGLHAYCDETDWNSKPVRGSADSILVNWYPAYRADWGSNQEGTFWRPSIHMPRWASRITLEVTSVRVERLQEISEEDARAEGLKGVTKDGSLVKFGIPDRDGWPGTDNHGWEWQDWSIDPRQAFRRLWGSINGTREGCAWADNPWVWVVEFRQVG